MLKPPTDIPASSLFLKLLEPEPSEVIDFPRKSHITGKPVGKIRIKALAHEDHDRARVQAFKLMREQGLSSEDLQSIGLREVMGDLIAKELLSLACWTEEEYGTDSHGAPVYGRVFRSGEEVGKVLRSDELAVLFNAYLMVCDKYGPNEHGADIDAWVKRLEEGGSAFPLLSLPLPDLAQLALGLTQRVTLFIKALESQRSSLPPMLVALLDDYGSGIGSAVSQQENSDQTGTLTSDDVMGLTRKLAAQSALADAMIESDG